MFSYFRGFFVKILNLSLGSRIITRDVEKLQFLAFSEQMLNMHLLQWLIRTPMKYINFLVIG